MDSVTTVPLKKLLLSERNVRKDVPENAVEEMAASLRAHGQLQNLIVTPSTRRRGFYEVDAGGLRWRGFRRLLEAGQITGDHPVAVREVAAEEARAASIRENVERWAMNPAEEAEAFAADVAEHGGDAVAVSLCARRTGKSREAVERQLRIARLPVEIRAALRTGAIGLAAANAYASVDDADLQAKVFREEQERRHGDLHRPANIRASLAGKTLAADCARLRYVGLDAYLAAGGRASADLFSLDAGDRLLDPAILNALAHDKAMTELDMASVRDGFGSAVLPRILVKPPTWPGCPAGFTPSAPWKTLADASAEERAAGIGVYTLDDTGAGLELVGWFRSLAAPAVAPPAAGITARPPLADTLPGRPHPGGDMRANVSPIRPGLSLHDQALRLVAARIAAEHYAGTVLEGHAEWPDRAGYIPPIAPAIGDDDTFLIAVQLRVSRSEIEAALPAAEEQLEAEAQANDHVAAANGDPDGGGGGVDPTPFASRR